jgi:hypothetical protein
MNSINNILGSKEYQPFFKGLDILRKKIEMGYGACLRTEEDKIKCSILEAEVFYLIENTPYGEVGGIDNLKMALENKEQYCEEKGIKGEIERLHEKAITLLHFYGNTLKREEKKDRLSWLLISSGFAPLEMNKIMEKVQEEEKERAGKI